MTIFDIALAHQRERERGPHIHPVSARDLALAAMIGRAQAGSDTFQPLTPPPPASEQVDLDQIAAVYAAGFEPVADDVTFDQ